MSSATKWACTNVRNRHVNPRCRSVRCLNVLCVSDCLKLKSRVLSWPSEAETFNAIITTVIRGFVNDSTVCICIYVLVCV